PQLVVRRQHAGVVAAQAVALAQIACRGALRLVSRVRRATLGPLRATPRRGLRRRGARSAAVAGAPGAAGPGAAAFFAAGRGGPGLGPAPARREAVLERHDAVEDQLVAATVDRVAPEVTEALELVAR